MATTQRRANEPAGIRSAADAREIEKFAAFAVQWWNPQGPFAALHRLNPLRLDFIRGRAASHFRLDPRALAPFGGRTLIDVGCGGGLLSEPLARMGFDVLGIDAGADNVAAASAHARNARTPVAYRCATSEAVAAERTAFDVVLAMEVIEHVSDRAAFLESANMLLKPGGLMFLATISRTLKALALAKVGAEYVLGWIPRGTHDWSKFVSPLELSRQLEKLGLSASRTQGVSFDPIAWEWRLSSDTSVNYMVVACKEAPTVSRKTVSSPR
jgi:2-polyprenyl-6-hydroxyphenyl methylase/3-demethylubiquinone-9 3-methyltransferase